MQQFLYNRKKPYTAVLTKRTIFVLRHPLPCSPLRRSPGENRGGHRTQEAVCTVTCYKKNYFFKKKSLQLQENTSIITNAVT
ncbi:hypothetical protein DXA36_22595 [Eisenbergiella sp. OF01-20]|nr:hypothetical protein DXA36_22595 [Eisenbergiella sp. OF01-20]